MRGFPAVALLLGIVAAAAAGELRDFSRPADLRAQPHDGWTSYEVYRGKGLSVHLVRVDPGVLRSVYREDVAAVSVAVRPARISYKHGQKRAALERGDFFHQRESSVGGGWVAARKGRGVDMLFISSSPDLPKDLDREAGRDAKREAEELGGRFAFKGGLPQFHPFKEARATIDAMNGAARRAAVLDEGGVTVELLRIAGAAAIKGYASAPAVLFAAAGAVRVRSNGTEAALRGSRVFVAEPGSTIRLRPDGAPAYVLMIAPSGTRELP